MDYNYEKISRGEYQEGVIHNQHEQYLPEKVAIGKPHSIVASIPKLGNKLVEDGIDVRSFLAYSLVSTESSSVITPFSIDRLPIDSDNIVDAMRHERAWKNHRSSALYLAHPKLERDGITLILLLLSNGAHSWRHTGHSTYPFAQSTLKLLGARTGGNPSESVGISCSWNATLDDCKYNVANLETRTPIAQRSAE